MYRKQIDFLTYIIGQAVNLVTPLVITPYLLITCGAEGLGKSAVGFSFAMFLILLIDYSFEIKSTRDIAATKDQIIISTIINHMISTKFILLLLLSILFYLSIWLFNSRLENWELFATSFLIVVAQAFSPVSVLQGLQLYRASAMINICSKLLYLILILSFVSSLEDYLLVNPIWAAANFFAFLAGYYFVFRTLQLKFIPSSASKIIKTLKTDFSYTISQLFVCFRQIVPQIMSGFFLGWETAGIYKIFDQLVSLVRSMNQAYFRFFLPKLSSSYSVSSKRSFKFWRQYSLCAFVGTTVLTIVALFCKAEVLTFFKMSPTQMASSGELYLITLLTIIVMPITIAGEQLMIVCDLLKTYTKIIYFISVATVLGIIFTAPAFGLEGIATIVLIAEILFAILYISYSQHKFFSIESK